jgi:hypothetical protein
MEIIRGVTIKSVLIIVPVALIAVFLERKHMSLGILAGWLFGVLNLRAMARNVKGFIGSEKAAAKLVFSSITRLFILLFAIALLIYSKAINVFGLLLGFTVVFIITLFEGIKAGRSG